MEFTGKVQNVSKDWKTGKLNITFEANEDITTGIDEIINCDKLVIKAKKWRKRRSTDANALLWACIGDIAAALRADKWNIYILMLRRYGVYTYICVKPEAVEAVKAQWRECEVIGDIDVGSGEKAVQMLCYFGSSTYNTKEFSVLLDGVISDMKEMGLTPPPSEEMRRALEQWEKHSQR